MCGQFTFYNYFTLKVLFSFTLKVNEHMMCPLEEILLCEIIKKNYCV